MGAASVHPIPSNAASNDIAIGTYKEANTRGHA
jgi:hypothetical protein